MTVVLDASALLAALLDEPGGQVVAGEVADAVISTVNLAEVASSLLSHGNAAFKVRGILATLECRAVAPDAEMATDAGLLRPLTDQRGLSLGDRFCLALARRLNAPALTADRAWADLGQAVEVEVCLIR